MKARDPQDSLPCTNPGLRADGSIRISLAHPWLLLTSKQLFCMMEMLQHLTSMPTTAYSLVRSVYGDLMGGPGPSSSATAMNSEGTLSRSSCCFCGYVGLNMGLRLTENLNSVF